MKLVNITEQEAIEIKTLLMGFGHVLDVKPNLLKPTNRKIQGECVRLIKVLEKVLSA